MPKWIHNPRQNRILSNLPGLDYNRLVDDLELVKLTLGQILYESGDVLAYIYFPTNCIVSLVSTTHNGSSAELAMTGNDGLVGFPLVLGGETTTHKVVVQSAGGAYRLRAEIVRWEFDQGASLQRLALRYTQALLTQIAQGVVCNRHHTVDQQLCRWLLLSLDQLPGNQLDMTQELIANMLGVRREAVTEAAGKLQAAGLIHYRRGHITVTDRPTLEQRVCECYEVVRSEYNRLFNLDPDTLLRTRTRPNPVTLRRRAEARLKQTTADAPVTPLSPTTPWETQRLLHELQVHTVELEMHNDELRHAYDEADSMRLEYADIYDFAPVGYFSLDPLGVITKMNLAGAILLGIKRSQCGRERFMVAVKPELWTVFEQFIAEVLEGRSKKSCKLVLSANAQRPEAVVKIEAAPDESGHQCRLVVLDITAETQAIQDQQEREQFQRALLDNFPFKVWLKDDQGRFLAVNAPFAQSYGWDSVAVPVGLTDFDILPPQKAQIYRDADLAVLVSGTKHSSEEHVVIKGETHWFETYRSPIEMDGHRIGTVGFARDITKRKLIENELRNLASTDPLTGLVNRRHFLVRLDEAYALMQREADHQVALLMLDLDHFKDVNDSYGHPAGDTALQFFGTLLRDELRKGETAGRVGGEEFAVLLPRGDLESAIVFAERIRQKIADTTLIIKQQKVSLTASIGVASMHISDASADRVLVRADQALYKAKASGRNRIESYTDQDATRDTSPDGASLNTISSDNELAETRSDPLAPDTHRDAPG